jgi:hypothetical protein
VGRQIFSKATTLIARPRRRLQSVYCSVCPSFLRIPPEMQRDAR